MARGPLRITRAGRVPRLGPARPGTAEFTLRLIGRGRVMDLALLALEFEPRLRPAVVRWSQLTPWQRRGVTFDDLAAVAGLTPGEFVGVIARTAFEYSEGLAQPRESTGTTKETVARRILRTREGDVERGIPIVPQMGKVTFDDAVDDLLNDYTINKKRTHEHAERRIELHLTPAFTGKRLLSITTANIRAYAAARKAAGAANATINRELALLKRTFSLAVKDGKLHGRPYIPMLDEDNTRRGFFEADQFEAVRKHLPEALRPVVTFAYLTGWRLKSEILSLEWRQVDWQGRGVRLDPGTTKNREGRTFPFTAALETLLKDQQAEHDRLKKTGRIVPLVFHRDGERIRDLRKAWDTACMAAGCPDRIPHDFRRTAVRNLERAGVPRSAAMAIIGHKTEAIYRRYAIVDAGVLREAAAKIDVADSVTGTTTGTTSSNQHRPTRAYSA